MGFLLDTLDEKKLKIQRDVVSNEQRQSYENRALRPGRAAAVRQLFPKPHPYYDCVIGTSPRSRRASMEDIRQFFRTFYAPQNASLAIVGDFNPKVVKTWSRSTSAPSRAGPEVKGPTSPQPPIQGGEGDHPADKHAAMPASDPRLEGRAPVHRRGARGRRARATCSGRARPAAVQGAGVREADRCRREREQRASASAGLFQITVIAAGAHARRDPARRRRPSRTCSRRASPREEVERATRNIIANRLRTAGAHRRLRRQGRPAQQLPDVPRRSRVPAERHREVPGGHPAGRAGLRAQVLCCLDSASSWTWFPPRRPRRARKERGDEARPLRRGAARRLHGLAAESRQSGAAGCSARRAAARFRSPPPLHRRRRGRRMRE